MTIVSESAAAAASQDQVKENPYEIPGLRTPTGELDGNLVCTTFGFEEVDYGALNRHAFPPIKLDGFDDSIFHHGCDLLYQLAIGAQSTLAPEAMDEQAARPVIHTFMYTGVNGRTPLDRIRQGEALAVLDGINGGIPLDLSRVNPEGYALIADALGFNRSELLALAHQSGLSVLEGIVYCLTIRSFLGSSLGDIKGSFDLKNGGNEFLPERVRLAQFNGLIGGRGLNVLFEIARANAGFGDGFAYGHSNNLPKSTKGLISRSSRKRSGWDLP
jgi:hypothetical protein